MDGCRGGWVAVCLAGRRGGPGYWEEPSASFLEHIDEIGQAFPRAQVIAIDIPIGLPEGGWRRADRAAQAFLGRRRSSVFSTPVRAALEAASYAEAKRVSATLTGAMPSRQAFNLAAKVLEVERWLPAAPCPVFEVHPEVSFALLLGHPATASKKTWAGMVERREALLGAGIDLDGAAWAAASRVAVDDVLDAGAAAWSAWRLLMGRARSFPDAAQGPAIWA